MSLPSGRSREQVKQHHPKGVEDDPMTTTRVLRLMVRLTVLTMVATGCGRLTGVAIGAGSGAAIGAGTGNTARGALIGTSVGITAGAIYDATHLYPYAPSPYDQGDYRRW